MTDYSNMSLREELAARFKEAEEKELLNEYRRRGWYYPAQVSPRSVPEMYDGDPVDLSAEFDGTNFKIRGNDNVLGDFGSQSGKKGYQGVEWTPIEEAGPIPEGQWLIKYDDLEKNDDPLTYSNRNDIIPWGRQRVKLQHVSGDNYGRDGFYVHGGYNGLGSAGCIDLGLQMPYFTRILDKYKQDVPLTVKYPRKFTRKK